MTDYLDRETRRLEDIDRAANLPSSDNINETSRRGLTAQQATDLKDITATCEKLTLAADQVAASAGPKGSDFHAISDRSKELGKHCTMFLRRTTVRSSIPTPIARSFVAARKPR